MKEQRVKDLMVPLSEYATVTEDATLFEAVLSLEEAQEKFENKHTRYRHRAILVLDKSDRVVGKLSQLDVLKALEPKYQDMIRGEGSRRYGFTKKFIVSCLAERLFNKGNSSFAKSMARRKENNERNTDSPRNCFIRSVLTAPATFLIPISWDLFPDWAVVRFIKLMHPMSNTKITIAEKIYTYRIVPSP